jgi:hypothetical protein
MQSQLRHPVKPDSRVGHSVLFLLGVWHDPPPRPPPHGLPGVLVQVWGAHY